LQKQDSNRGMYENRGMRVHNGGMGLNNEHKRKRNKGMGMNNDSERPNNRPKRANNKGMGASYRI